MACLACDFIQPIGRFKTCEGMDILHPLQKNVVQAVSRNGSCDEHWWWRLAATLCPRATAGADRSATVAAKVSAAAARIP